MNPQSTWNQDAAHDMAGKLAARHWPNITLDDLGRVLPRFPQAGRPQRILWHSPRPFSAACLVETSHGALFVKRHDQSVRSGDDLAEEHGFIAHLRGHGLSVPRVLAVDTGQSSFTDGPWTYEVHERAVGEDTYGEAASWTPFHSPAHARAAGRTLARLHVASHGYAAPARRSPVLVARFHWLRQADLAAAIEHDLPQRPLLRQALAERPWREDLQRVVQPWHAQFAPLAKHLPLLWTHNDWHASNLLWSPAAVDGVSAVLDFGLADRTTALYDLATAIERNTIPWLAIQAGKNDSVADFAGLDALLHGYESVLPLSAADRAVLTALLPLVHVEFAFAEIEYFASVVQADDDADLAYHAFLLGHADWFASHAGQALLRHLQP